MVWLVFAIYIDSYIFVVATAVLQHSLGVNSGSRICEAEIILCLACYVTTKVIFIYLFLVEKAYIIRGVRKPRLKSTMYVVNSLSMLTIYIGVVVLNFFYRIARMSNGECIIGMKKVSMIFLISYDVLVNVYLTIMFLMPLKRLYSYSNMARTQAHIRLQTVAFRTFCGTVGTLISSIANLSVLMALNGEPGWMCLMCCNCDILFSVIIIQWVTSKDHAGTESTSSSGEPRRSRDLGSGAYRSSTPTRRRSHDDDRDDLYWHETDLSNIVTVTTTIKQEIEPNANHHTRLHLPCGRDCRMSVKSGAMDGILPLETKITAGTHSLEGSEQTKVDA
ncbi:hypothetical protein ACQKWADRAFT_291086 [Trichoderma austrokoningii]